MSLCICSRKSCIKFLFNFKSLLILKIARLKTLQIAFLVNHRPFTLPCQNVLDVIRESYKRVKRCAIRQLVASSARLHL